MVAHQPHCFCAEKGPGHMEEKEMEEEEGFAWKYSPTGTHTVTWCTETSQRYLVYKNSLLREIIILMECL